MPASPTTSAPPRLENVERAAALRLRNSFAPTAGLVGVGALRLNGMIETVVDQASGSVEMIDEIGIIDDFAAEMSPEQATELASFTGYFGTPVAVSDWADPRASCPPNDNPGWYEVDGRLP